MKSNNILATDLDGTLTRGGDDPIKPQVKESLLHLKNSGWILILATGRDREYLMRRSDIKWVFDAWVTEAGLAVYLPSEGTYRCFASDEWIMEIKKLTKFPFIIEKENTVAFGIHFLNVVKRELQRIEVDAIFRSNKGLVMLLPEGINKAYGVMEALKLLNVNGPIVAIGDSEIDLELFKVARFKATVANAEEALKKEADYIASQENGDGVTEIIKSLSSQNVSQWLSLQKVDHPRLFHIK
ncbi:MAG: HAD hydrolase family protein [Candidatus Bathyarchaeia archaeon]